MGVCGQEPGADDQDPEHNRPKLVHDGDIHGRRIDDRHDANHDLDKHHRHHRAKGKLCANIRGFSGAAPDIEC